MCEAFEHVAARTPARLPLNPASLIIPAELREAHRGGIRRYLRTGESNILGERLEMQAVRRDGTSLPVELTLIALEDYDPPLFAGFVRDLTSLHEAAAEQARLTQLERGARIKAEVAERRRRGRGARASRRLTRRFEPPMAE